MGRANDRRRRRGRSVAAWLARVRERKRGAWERGGEASASASVASRAGPCASFRGEARLTGKGFRFARSAKSVKPHGISHFFLTSSLYLAYFFYRMGFRRWSTKLTLWPSHIGSDITLIPFLPGLYIVTAFSYSISPWTGGVFECFRWV